MPERLCGGRGWGTGGGGRFLGSDLLGCLPYAFGVSHSGDPYHVIIFH